MAFKGKWYLVQLKPNGFDRAVTNLERQNLHTFMPFRKKYVRNKNRQIEKKHPLFPGYIFVDVNPSIVSWRSVNSTYGVARVVSFGSQSPMPLPGQLIDGLKARCDEELILLPPDDLRVGERVKIISGPFADYVATIESIPAETRLGILFDCMGQKMPAQIHVNHVERVFD